MYDFGWALQALKNRCAVARAGWSGPQQFAYMVPAAAYPAQTGVAKAAFPLGLVPYRAYLALKTVQGDVAVWTPSTSDLLANDWMLAWRPEEASQALKGETK
jgi:hypothetical protein